MSMKLNLEVTMADVAKIRRWSIEGCKIHVIAGTFRISTDRVNRIIAIERRGAR